MAAAVTRITVAVNATGNPAALPHTTTKESTMNTATGRFSIIADGVTTDVDFKALPYGAFFLMQSLVLDLLCVTRSWGLSQLCGLPDPNAGDPATGDVGYTYQADFSGGGTSDGHNTWHGIPAGAAKHIADKLHEAAAALKTAP